MKELEKRGGPPLLSILLCETGPRGGRGTRIPRQGKKEADLVDLVPILEVRV